MKRDIEIIWDYLCLVYKERMEENGMPLLKYVSHEEMLCLIEQVNLDGFLSDDMKVLATRALLQRDSADARALIAGRCP